MVDIVPPIVPPVGTPWYEGKATAEDVGHWQNKGWDIKDPAAMALAAGKAHREAERLIGVPPSELLRLPKDKTDEAGWTNVWTRLGAPSDPKEYDMPALKGADGKVTNEGLDAVLRAAFGKVRLPKEQAIDVSGAVAKYIADQQTGQQAERTAAVTEQRQALAKDWQTTPEKIKESPFFAIARNAAVALKIDPAALDALESQVGYAGVMKMLHSIGTKIGEDKFFGGGDKTNAGPMTVGQAKDELALLKADPVWTKRYLDGGAEERRKMTSLLTIISA